MKEAIVNGELTSETARILVFILKTLHLALTPVQYLAAVQDRYKSFLDRSIRRVPKEQRVVPAPQILGPILEEIRYEPEGTPALNAPPGSGRFSQFSTDRACRRSAIGGS